MVCPLPESLRSLIDLQCGVVCRSQVLGAGLADGAIGARIASGRWRRLHPGVYLTQAGTLSREAQIWAGLLYAGSGAVVSHDTAAELWSLADSSTSSAAVHLTIPADRRVRPRPGVRIHYARNLLSKRHPARSIPVTRIEETVLDLIDLATGFEQVVDRVTRACGGGRTTPQRLREAMGQRSRMRWRRQVEALLTDVGAGARSPLELAYLRRVERAHGLPRGHRQQHRTVGTHTQWIDVDYEQYHLIVELDGRLGHIGAGRFRDHRRDNVSTLRGRETLRYGWTDTVLRPCDVAAEVATILQRNGWPDPVRPCGAGCTLTRAA